MESMIAIFEHIGGVPTEIWFDNTSTIVTKILKDGGRQLTDRFLRFSEHYGFRYRFMNPESGWEKGSVENKVGYVRRNFLVPPPRFTNLADFNKELLEEADRDMEREHYHYDQTIRGRYEEGHSFHCRTLPLTLQDIWQCLPINGTLHTGIGQT